MQKRFNPGPAARNGVTAALMAKLGFTGAATIFDGERGFLRAFTDKFDLGELTRELDKDYRRSTWNTRSLFLRAAHPQRHRLRA